MADDVALDEFARLAGGLAEGGGSEAVEVAHRTDGGLVKQHDRIAGEGGREPDGVAKLTVEVAAT